MAETIALVKLSALGDVVHALPVACALRVMRPQARLVWVVERREAALLAGHPALDAVVVSDLRRWRRPRGPRALLETAREIRALRRELRRLTIDVALDLQGLVKSGMLTLATGAPARIGFQARWCREPLSALFTNRRVALPPRAAHAVDECLGLLAPLGVPPDRVTFGLPPNPRAEVRADEILAAAGLKARRRLVVLNPGAGRDDKRWPPACFRELGERLAADLAASVLVVWGPGEDSIARDVVEGVRAPGVVLAPPTDLHELIAVLRRASVVVAADTGPLHLAAAVGTPCVGLFGPTPAARNGPYGPGQRALAAPDGRMTSITVGEVLRLAGEALG
ncbi:MAG: lipopolysaccharide heptosyltransferase I [Candidatus Rokubacteria bacterium]|nr:lipopolysaccharide heptosyltransferase I [Candidatus Rokubacteria bacterium]MBI3827742.1 lipopolysaccharide heptosyltransferase I [Candidatus Rokubacteria bacterium]